MRIAKDIANKPIECDGNTPQEVLYFCCICGGKVYPRNDLKKEHGRKKEYYFAHYSETCSGSLESYLHWIAKQIVANAQEINLPDGKYIYEAVVLECTTLDASVRPDVLLNQEVIIEICYRNPKREREISVFRKLNLTAVEIDLSVLDFNSSLKEIEGLVLRETHNKKYLHKKQNSVPVPDQPEPVPPLIVLAGIFLALFGIRKIGRWISGNRSLNLSHTRGKRRAGKRWKGRF